MTDFNYPLTLLGACFLAAASAALGNAIKGDDIRKCAIGGLATAAFGATFVYLWLIIVGTPFPQ